LPVGGGEAVVARCQIQRRDRVAPLDELQERRRQEQQVVVLVGHDVEDLHGGSLCVRHRCGDPMVTAPWPAGPPSQSA
jgi:hypothetical protein